MLRREGPARPDSDNVVVVATDVVVVLAAPEILGPVEEPEEQPAIPTAAATVAIPATDFLTMAIAALFVGIAVAGSRRADGRV